MSLKCYNTQGAKCANTPQLYTTKDYQERLVKDVKVFPKQEKKKKQTM